MARDSQKGDAVTITSVLLPHDPTRNPSKLATEIEVAVDNNDATAVKVPLSGGRSCWLAVGPVETESFTTKSKATVVVMKGKEVLAEGSE